MYYAPIKADQLILRPFEALERCAFILGHFGQKKCPAQQALLRRAVPPPRGGAIAPPLGTALSESTSVASNLQDGVSTKDTLTAGHQVGNHASAKILQALGFREIGRCLRFCAALQKQVESVDLILTRQEWQARQEGAQ